MWNPSFDVTPGPLIRGIITEIGVAEAAPVGSPGWLDGIIDIPAFLKSKDRADLCTSASVPANVPIGFKRMTESDIALFVASNSRISSLLGCVGGQSGADSLDVKEVGDGNLNFVYIIKGPAGTLVVKQALPYVRCVGESWPLSIDRISFECNALKEQRRLAPSYVPEVFFFSRSNALLVMQYIPPPHIILRKAFLQGHRYSTFAAHLGTFLADTLFGTSALAIGCTSLRHRISEWSRNTSLCALTEQVVFTDPYVISPYNRWTAPQLDAYAAGIRADRSLKRAIAELKTSFITNTQALLHGDLHTGSVMACEGSTYVIDPEFAYYGPMGFDVGALLANMLLAYFSQPGHHGEDYAEWLLSQIRTIWGTFTERFLHLWSVAASNGVGEIYSSSVLDDSLKSQYVAQLWKESLGFAGAKMIRRIVGIAHVADLEEIKDADIRAICEKRSLLFARKLMLFSRDLSSEHNISSLDELLDLARSLSKIESPLVWPTL